MTLFRFGLNQDQIFLAENEQSGVKSPFRDGQNPFTLENISEFVALVRANQREVICFGMAIVGLLFISFMFKSFLYFTKDRTKLSDFKPQKPHSMTKINLFLNRSPSNPILMHFFTSNTQIFVIIAASCIAVIVFIYKFSEFSYFLIAFKSGLLSMIYISMLYILPLKYFPLTLIVPDYSYETYLIYHKWLGIITCCILFIHIVTFIRTLNWWYIFSDLACQMGILLMIGFGLIFLTSITIFRNHYYEVFKFVHYICYWVCLPMLYFHVESEIYKKLVIVLSIFLVINKALMYKNTWILKATFEFKKNCEFILIKIERKSIFKFNDSVFQYKLSNHIYICIPEISCWQSHPFTVISSPMVDKDTLKILVKRQKGFTGKLFEHLEQSLEGPGCCDLSMFVVIDGPYGNTHSHLPYQEGIFKITDIVEDECARSGLANIRNETEPLLRSNSSVTLIDHMMLSTTVDIETDPISLMMESMLKKNILLISGGSGIAFTLPIYQTYKKFYSTIVDHSSNMHSLITKRSESGSKKRYIPNLRLVWIVRDRSCLDFSVFKDLKDDLNVILVITSEVGRVSVNKLIQQQLAIIDETSGTREYEPKIEIMACGSSDMMNDIRMAVDIARGEGRNIDHLIEEFNW